MKYWTYEYDYSVMFSVIGLKNNIYSIITSNLLYLLYFDYGYLQPQHLYAITVKLSNLCGDQTLAAKVNVNLFVIPTCQRQSYKNDDLIDFWCLTPLSAIFQLYQGDQIQWWKKPQRTTDHGQATGKLYHLRLKVECALFCNLLTPYW